MSTIMMQEFGMYQLYVILPTGVAISIAIWFTSPKNIIPRYFILLEIYGSIVALVWTYLVNVLLIDLLRFIGNFYIINLGMLTNLPRIFLALTVLGMGNGLTDTFTTLALCRQGSAVMAMTGALIMT